MPTCRSGHQSDDAEYCDICGIAMDVPTEVLETASASTSASTQCRACGAAVDGRFCEACGADTLATVVSATRTAPLPVPLPTVDLEAPVLNWTVVIAADREYFEVVQAAEGPDAAAVTFPPYCPERYFPLQGKQISVGRRSASRGIHPDIDLTGPPEDPGVSRQHALLVSQPGGTWAVVDLGSANGTTVNTDTQALTPNVPRPLMSGDRIHVGAWTTITIRTL